MAGYQEIDYRELKMRVLAPDSVNKYIQDNEPFSISGHPSKGEGGDFVLENKNNTIENANTT